MKKFQVKLAFMVILILIENKNAKAFQFSEQIPHLTQAIKSYFDLYGQIAENQKNGASYEYFAKLLPAPRYVNADFRYYPIVLSAPESKIKARLISNGQGVNIKSGSRSWKDIG